jgi:hypothetical protein
MRALFLVLLVANAAFFAWSRYYAPESPGSDPRPLARQIEPEKLRIVAPNETLPSAPALEPSASSSSGAGSNSSCLEWGSFSAAEAPRAEKAIEPLALGARLATRQEHAGWWVFIAPQPSRQDAQRKALELKALGVDYFIVQDGGSLRWALSLGVFRTEEAARTHLEKLRARGVSTAQVAARDTPAPRIWLQIKGADAPLRARLKEIASDIEGSALRECASG